MDEQWIDTDRLPRLRPILEQWIRSIRRYHTQMEDDHAWHYHERAQVGFLAAAAWLAGGVALEEWRSDKRAGVSSRKGRCDLYVYRKPFAGHFEAKHAWIHLDVGSVRAAQRVETELNRAVANAGDLVVPRGDAKLGVLFAAPVIPRRLTSQAESVLHAWLQEVRHIRCEALAWVFSGKLLVRRRIDVYPGCVLVARRPGRLPKNHQLVK